MSPTPTEGDTPPGRFHAALLERYEAAARHCGGQRELWLVVAGAKVRICFAGRAVEEVFTRALDHGSTPATPPADFTVNVFDSQTSGVLPPPPPWPGSAYGPRGEVDGFNDETHQTVHDPAAGCLSVLHRPSRSAVYWSPTLERIPSWEQALPFRALWHGWTHGTTLQMVHAGAVGRAQGGVLLTGPGGSGKSTSTLACLGSGLGFAGDDFVLVDVPVGHEIAVPTVHGVFATAKVKAENLHRFPRMATHGPGHLEAEKHIFFLSRTHQTDLIHQFPLKAILLPHVSDRTQTRIREASAAASLRAVAPSTMFLLPGARDAVMRKLGRLVRLVPSFHLDVGTDLTRIPACIDELLGQLGAGPE